MSSIDMFANALFAIKDEARKMAKASKEHGEHERAAMMKGYGDVIYEIADQLARKVSVSDAEAFAKYLDDMALEHGRSYARSIMERNSLQAAYYQGMIIGASFVVHKLKEEKSRW